MLKDQTACVDTCFNLHCERNLIHIHPTRVGSLASFKATCEIYKPKIGFPAALSQLIDWIKPVVDHAVENDVRILKFYHLIMVHIVFELTDMKLSTTGGQILTPAQEETAEKLLLFFDLSPDNLPWKERITCYVRKVGK
jgi:hypothetical protein